MGFPFLLSVPRFDKCTREYRTLYRYFEDAAPPRIVISSESEKSFSFAIDQEKRRGQRITGNTVPHATWDHGASCRQHYEGKGKRETKKIPRLGSG